MTANRTPLRPDPESIQRARELYFDPPLDEGIREIVLALVANGVETFHKVTPLPSCLLRSSSCEAPLAFIICKRNWFPEFNAVAFGIHNPSEAPVFVFFRAKAVTGYRTPKMFAHIR